MRLGFAACALGAALLGAQNVSAQSADSAMYIVRLGAFLLLLAAIVDKNRKSERQTE